MAQQHREATLALLYLRQNDPSDPSPLREQWKRFGLPKDEFPDNGHMPYEIYARETRRIHGRAVLTENDARLAPALERAPVHADSISITGWFLDSHACTPRRVPGSEGEGKVMLKNRTFPGHVPFGTILPQVYENVVVPVCLSATHVGWGIIRLEPTWMSIAEAAALAVVTARRTGLTVTGIDVDGLVRLLADRGFVLSFFNDVEAQEDAPWFPAIQYFGTKGYFSTYAARSGELLTVPVANVWIEHTAGWARGGRLEPTDLARKVLAAEQASGPSVSAREFARRLVRVLPAGEAVALEVLRDEKMPIDRPITRGDACQLLYRVTDGAF